MSMLYPPWCKEVLNEERLSEEKCLENDLIFVENPPKDGEYFIYKINKENPRFPWNENKSINVRDLQSGGELVLDSDGEVLIEVGEVFEKE